jgi:hypothetical protein
MVFHVDYGAIGYISACYIGFFIGCLLVSGGSIPTPIRVVKSPFNKKIFWLTVFLGSLGMALRLYDRFILRGVSLSETAMEARELIADTGAGPLAAVGGLLYPTCYLPLFLWWGRRNTEIKIHWSTAWVAGSLFMLPGIDALTLLSRSQILVALSMMYVSAACILYRGRAFHSKLIIPTILGASLLTAISIFAFTSRLTQMEMDAVFSILNSAYGYVLIPNESALALIQGSSFTSKIAGATIPLAQYYLHGVFEFFLLWEHSSEMTFTLGTQTFAPYLKALNIFGMDFAPTYDLESSYYRVGVFTSFFGPLWMDFGWLGPLFLLFFGAFSKKISLLARSGRLEALPLHSFFMVVIFFMPVVNFMISATGMYIINALLIFFLISKPPSYKLPPENMQAR